MKFGSKLERSADPYVDTDVIDARAPRFNQAVIGSLSVVALVTGWWWLLGFLALQLIIGLTLGGAGACRASPTTRSCSRGLAKGRWRTRVRPGLPT